MRKIVAGLFVSLDGVADAPDGWHFPFLTDEWHEVIDAEIAQTDSVLLGRRTYADFAQLWPNQGSDVPMADFMNNTRKYVVSSTLETLEWANSTLLTGPLVEELTRLKHEPGRNILILGSPTLVQTLLSKGLLDELTLTICPIVIGTGLRLFDKVTDRVRLRVLKSRTLSNGVLLVTYQPFDA